MSFAIRPFHPSDMYALYRICLLTGASGKDASHLFKDHELLGHMYAAPYAIFEPDLCFILTHNHAPVGYVLGTRDSASFAERCENEWFPTLRLRYPMPDPNDESRDAILIRRFHEDQRSRRQIEGYPAHLHIDILPVGQNQGLGRGLIKTFIDKLRSLGVPGVHLGVAADNERAIRFYERVGFTRLPAEPPAVLYGMRLSPAESE